MNSLELVAVIGLLILTLATTFVLGLLLRFERRKRAYAVQIPESSNSSDSSRAFDQAMAKDIEEVRFESVRGRAAIELSIPSQKYMKNRAWQRIELDDQSREWLSPLLDFASHVLKLSLLGQLASSHSFRLIFHGAGELMRAGSGDGFRPILIDRNSHRIISQGLLIPAGQGLANGLILWECAATLVGRKYLADINRTLNRIDTGIAKIQSFLENDRIGKLQADCKFLLDIANSLHRDPSFLFYNGAFQRSIEAVEQNASSVARACLLDLEASRRALDTDANPYGLFNADLSRLDDGVSRVIHILQCATFALSLRVCAATYLSSYVVDGDLKNSRLADVMALWEQLSKENLQLQSTIGVKIDSMGELFSRGRTVEAKKRAVKSGVAQSFLVVAQALESIKDDTERAIAKRGLLEVASKPIELAITVDREGRILTAQMADRP